MHLHELAKHTRYDLAKRFLGLTNNKMKVYVINGEYVRDFLDTDFIGGGHHMVYKFIPKDEIWVEEMECESDQRGIVIHELVEHMLMEYFGLPYLEAHRIANSMEHRFRQKFRLQH